MKRIVDVFQELLVYVAPYTRASPSGSVALQFTNTEGNELFIGAVIVGAPGLAFGATCEALFVTTLPESAESVKFILINAAAAGKLPVQLYIGEYAVAFDVFDEYVQVAYDVAIEDEMLLVPSLALPAVAVTLNLWPSTASTNVG